MADPATRPDRSKPGGKLTRRQALGLGSVFALGWGLAGTAIWWRRREHGQRADVFIGKATSYEADLVSLVAAGLKEVGVARREIQGKRVLLKPNLVETAVGQAHINTHPAVVVAAAEVFRRLDAAEVFVAEAQGHRRDSWLVLDESGMGQALAEAGLRFVDLNHDDVEPVPNRGSWTNLKQLYLPKTLRSADIIVSMPKLKTHHWAGVTCAMKNLFGVMPGIVYGWPKNVLHWSGIPNSILDINATVRPTLAIVDGIVGMDGDGPIMGNPKRVGAVVIGKNLTAVDATCVRLMDLNPSGVAYLAQASGRLGPLYERNIKQLGEPIADLRTPFEVLDLPHLSSVCRL
ncbi:MAG: DUF362 domain-containing protein [Planctomycetes bacterium]|nr:DUF362 domain-containing protein [Planctomycetota bacterium]